MRVELDSSATSNLTVRRGAMGVRRGCTALAHSLFLVLRRGRRGSALGRCFDLCLRLWPHGIVRRARIAISIHLLSPRVRSSVGSASSAVRKETSSSFLACTLLEEEAWAVVDVLALLG